ncbi:MAG: ATP-dependent RNA helicase HrpA [Pseudomonadaceae bacterium]|nr:ATP-dependent RNA helicase HrpA [Pseudomonadaceae bacterium]
MCRDVRWLGKAGREDKLIASAAKVVERERSVPHLSIDDVLPIAKHAADIEAALAQHQVVVVAGETGSGKTTQLPKICLKAGLGRRGTIAHTQPRRLAARAVSARIADELQVPLGEQVGFATRFSDQSSERTLVKLMTDGLLLAELQNDRNLLAYDTIIVDEAHERSLNIDFLLGYLKGLIKRRRDLRVIITSATIDVDAYAAHFGGAPIIDIPGRGYPVTIRYEPPESSNIDEAVAGALASLPRGRDVLVFLPGEREIADCSRLLRRELDAHWEVIPLYARLSAAEQQKVFAATSRRRVVLATNVAETSLTVPNIEFVIDPGVARVSRYSFRSKLQRLPVEPVSQASANQRAGRCGRIAPGTCVRLYDEADFLSRPEFTEPEIRRTNLAGVALTMRARQLGVLSDFPFLDRPEGKAISDAERLLEELGALEAGKLTRTGKLMARLPIDPRLGRMLVEAANQGALTEVLIIVAGLAVPDIRERPMAQRGAADAAHDKFVVERSDLLSLLAIWEWAAKQKEKLTNRRFRRAMADNFLNFVRFREWRDLHRQLKRACQDCGFRFNDVEADYASIHKALLAGSLSMIGQHDEKGTYIGARNLKFRIFPGSSLSDKRPRWLMAISIVETSAVYARSVAAIEPRWLEHLAVHLLKRSHTDPHYSDKRGEVMAYERATLYGLPVVDRKLVRFGPIDQAQARRLFMADGLLPGAVRSKLAFLEDNLELVSQLREFEDKGRRRDLIASDELLMDFYDARLPADVVGVASLKRALKREPALHETLRMTRASLVLAPDQLPGEQDFPSEMSLGDLRLALSYAFAPGSAEDGVSLLVPVGVLPALTLRHTEWLVPGLLEPLTQAWLRTLPKRLRRQMTPLPDYLPGIVSRLQKRYGEGRLPSALSEVLRDEVGATVTASDWDIDRIPPELCMRVCVINSDGKIESASRSLESLQQQYSDQTAQATGQAKATLEIENLAHYPKDGLPEEQLIASNSGTASGGESIVYPAIDSANGQLSYRLLRTADEAAAANRRGFPALALTRLAKAHRQMRRQIASEKTLGLHYAGLGDSSTLTEQICRAATWACLFENHDLPRTESAFDSACKQRAGQLMTVFAEMLGEVAGVLSDRFELVRSLADNNSPAFAPACADIEKQLKLLVPGDFMEQTPLSRLRDLRRYMAGHRYRLEHLQGKVDRDQQNQIVIAKLDSRVFELSRVLSDDEALDIRFGLQEVRLGLFAEPLQSRKGFSVKRFDKQLAAAEREHALR